MSTESTSQSSQVKRFEEAARELECDDDPKRFAERLGKLAKHKAKPPPPQNESKRS